MPDDLGTYVVVLVLGIGAVLAVGQVLLRTGRAILEDAFGGQQVAHSVNGLFAVLFHLGALGMLAVISRVDVSGTSAVQTVVTTLGIILLILGAALGLFILALTRIRAHSRRQAEREMSLQLQAARRPAATDAPIVENGSSLPR